MIDAMKTLEAFTLIINPEHNVSELWKVDKKLIMSQTDAIKHGMASPTEQFTKLTRKLSNFVSIFVQCFVFVLFSWAVFLLFHLTKKKKIFNHDKQKKNQ